MKWCKECNLTVSNKQYNLDYDVCNNCVKVVNKRKQTEDLIVELVKDRFDADKELKLDSLDFKEVVLSVCENMGIYCGDEKSEDHYINLCYDRLKRTLFN